MTLNLAAAPVLIGCADRQNSAEMTDAQESKLNEQSPNVSILFTIMPSFPSTLPEIEVLLLFFIR